MMLRSHSWERKDKIMWPAVDERERERPLGMCFACGVFANVSYKSMLQLAMGAKWCAAET